MAIPDLVAGLRQACSGLPLTWIAGLIMASLLVRDVVAWYRLRHIPGPFLNTISMLPLLYRIIRGDSQEYMDKLAAKYGNCHDPEPTLPSLDQDPAANRYTAVGPMVRIAPGDVMFTDADFFRRVGSVRGGYTKAGWYDCTQFQHGPVNLIGLKDDETRRARKAQLSPGVSSVTYLLPLTSLPAVLIARFVDADAPNYFLPAQYYGKGLESFEVGVDKQLAAFIDLIESKYISDDKTFRPIDFSLRASFFTLDVISQVAYSHPFGFMEKDCDLHDFNRIVQDLIPAMAFMSLLPRLARAMHYWPLNKFLPTQADKIGFGPLLKYV